MVANPLWLNVGHILPMGMADLSANDQDSLPTGVAGGRKYAKGQLGLTRDAFGFRIFRYMHSRAVAATVAGVPYVRAAEVTSTLLGTQTTTVLQKASGFTADALIGRLVYIKTNSSVAAAAPEGETAVIVANTADKLFLDENYPLSAAPNSGDTFEIHSIYDFIVTAGGELAKDVFGLAVAIIDVGNWGMIQQYGYCPGAVVSTTPAVTKDVPLITVSTPGLAAGTSPASKLWVAWAPVGANSPNSGKMLVFVNTFSPFGPAAAS